MNDILLVIGQSNAEGRGSPTDRAIDVGHPRIRQRPLAGSSAHRVIAANDPLILADGSRNGRVGPAVSFCRSYVEWFPDSGRIVIVMAAQGATGFADRRWNVGDDLYVRARDAATTALRAGSAHHRLAAMLWVQGESDAGHMSAAAYRAALDAMIAGLRSDIPGAAHCPFLIGQMVPEFVQSSPGALAIDAVHRDAPNRIARVGFAEGLSGSTQPGDIEHYNAAGARALGRTLADQFAGIVRRAPGSQAAPAANRGASHRAAASVR